MARNSLSFSARRPAALILAAILACGVLAFPAGLAFVPGPRQAMAQAAAPAADPAPAPAQQGVFPDVSGHWAEATISLLAVRDVVSGFADGLFRPEDGLTRAQFAKLAVAGLEGSSVAELLGVFPPVFADLEGHWARGWVAAARELDVVRGYSRELFGPDDGMTRSQVAAVLVRALGWDEEAAELAASGGAAARLAGFVDASSVPGWAAGYLALAVESGLMRGYTDGTLGPENPVTRAEAATFLARALDLLSLAYDLGGELADVDESGRIWLTRIWGRPGGEPGATSLSLETTSSAVCFRNGRAAQLADIVPGDFVLVVLGRRTGTAGGARAAYIHALSWDLLGTLVAVDGGNPEAPLCLVDAGGREVGVVCGPEAEVFRHGRAVAAADLNPGDRVYVLFDPLTGRGRFVDAVRPDVSGVVVATGLDDGRHYLEVAPGPEVTTGTEGPGDQGSHAGDPAETAVVYLGEGAFVSIDGYPAAPDALSEGLNVVFAELDAETASAGYCEAWSAEQAAHRPGTAGAWPAASPGAGRPLTGATTLALVEARSADSEPAVALPPPGPDIGRGVSFLPPAAPGQTQIAPGWSLVEVLDQIGASVAATGAPDLRSATGADGSGVTLAVIDTGVDPGHPVLTTGPAGRAKLVDWVDFTDEGLVVTISTSPSYRGYVATALGAVGLGAWRSRSGIYRCGVIDEGLLGPLGGPGVDLNGNGRLDDRYAVVVIDSTVAGLYDLVLIDTDQDLDLADEEAVGVFSSGGGVLSFGSAAGPQWTGPAGMNAVVCAIAADGTSIELGFDANGHGTHVAAVAAGHDPQRPEIQVGMAPGAEIIALKALGSDGSGDWRVIREAVAYAGEHGADAVVLAVESSRKPRQGSWDALEDIAVLARNYAMPVFIAAGNAGPGLMTTICAPQDELLVPVGGFIPAELWSGLYGKDVAGGSLWLYGAAGPGDNGSTVPLLLAPAAAVSAVPQALHPDGYDLFEGTSMAAPHVAGAAALLIQAARTSGAGADPAAVVRSLAAGARPLEGVSPAEQGYGVLDVPAAAAYLSDFSGGGRLAMSFLPGYGAGTGAIGLEPEGPPALLDLKYVSWPVTVSSPGGPLLAAELGSRYGRLEVDRPLVYVPGGIDRRVTFSAGGDLAPGAGGLLDLITASDPRTGEPLAQLVAQIVDVPPVLPGGGEGISFSGRCARAGFSRRYFEVPEGALNLSVTLTTKPHPEGAVHGMVRGFVYSPGGFLISETGLVGVDGVSERTLELRCPPPGIWELVVWGSPEYTGSGGLSRFYWEVCGDVLDVTVDPARLDLPQVPASSSLRVGVELDVPEDTGELIVEALGWNDGAGGLMPWRTVLELGPDGAALWELPAVKRGLGLLEISAVGLTPVDADLYVYRLEPSGPGGWGEPRWVEVGRSVTAGDGAELVTIWAPAPGEYAVMVETPGAEDFSDVALEARRWTSGWTLLDEIHVEQGFAGSVDLELPLPAGLDGECRADIVVREASSLRVLVSAPVVVGRGVPGLVCAAAPSLGRRLVGEAAPPALVRVFGGDGMVPVDGELALAGASAAAGRLIQVDDGVAVLDPVAAGGAAVPGFALEVEVQAGGYRTWAGMLLPAGAGPGSPVPADVGGSPPFPPGEDEPAGLRGALRRKCIWQQRPEH